MNDNLEIFSNKDFYPTPEWLVEKMLKMVAKDSHASWSISEILEPSAGKGDIVQAIYQSPTMKTMVEHSRSSVYQQINIDTIENSKPLASILKDVTGIKPIYDDFLSFDTHKLYDLIIMNPPFSEGDKHLVKAIQLMTKVKSHSGDIVCLLNSKTIHDKDLSNMRKSLHQLLELYEAHVEFLESPFEDAERKTGVDVALVHIRFNGEALTEDEESLRDVSDVFETLHKKLNYSSDLEESNGEANEIVYHDPIDRMIQCFNNEVQAGIALIDTFNRARKYFDTCFTGENIRMSVVDIKGNHEEGTLKKAKCFQKYGEHNKFIEATREKYWRGFFNSPILTEMFTSNILNTFRSNLHDMYIYDLSLIHI